MNTRMFARLGTVIFVIGAIVAGLAELTRPAEAPGPARTSSPAKTGVDPLRAELDRCRLLGEAGARDAACLDVWAENRRRFLAPKPEAR